MIDYKLILDLAILLLVTKIFGIIASKLQLPQVVGNLLGGLLVGPAVLGWVTPTPDSPINLFAKVGVILIMFSAGLETDIKHLKSTGLASIIITILGVLVPLGGGFLIAGAFHGFSEENLITNLFHGVVLTATSVSITVSTLKEMGKLNTKVGASILSAALLDDIIGLFILTIVLGASGDGASASNSIFIKALVEGGGLSNIAALTISTLLFFITTIVAGFIVNKLFRFLSKKFPGTRRLSIFSLVFALFMAYLAEEIFGIADVTGSFIAGVALSNLKDTEYIEKKIDTTSYMVFAPIFFANIGLQASFDNFTGETVAFAICFTIVGLLAKVIGCGLGAKISRYSNKDSLRVGFGMMARAEVALIVVQKAIDKSLIEPEMITIVLLLIIVSSLITPICLKLVYKKDKNNDDIIKSNINTVPTEYDDFLQKG